MKKTPLKRGKLVYKNKKKESPTSKNEMWEFFLSIWKSRPHRSEVSGKYLQGQPLSTMFHHIILKSDMLYGELGKFDEENIILLSMEEHEVVHKDATKYEEINKRRERLIEKYEKIRGK